MFTSMCYIHDIIIYRALDNQKQVPLMLIVVHYELTGNEYKYKYYTFDLTYTCRVVVLEKGSPNSMCLMESGKVRIHVHVHVHVTGLI